MSYFLPYSYNNNIIEVEIYLSNYAAKSELKRQQVQIHRNFLKKDHLVNLKSQVDNADIDKLPEIDDNKLNPVSIGLKKLSDLFVKKVVKKDIYLSIYLSNSIYLYVYI